MMYCSYPAPRKDSCCGSQEYTPMSALQGLLPLQRAIFPKAMPSLGRSIMAQCRTTVIGHFSSGLPWGQLRLLSGLPCSSTSPQFCSLAVSLLQVLIPKALTNKHSPRSTSLCSLLPREPRLHQTLPSISPIFVNISISHVSSVVLFDLISFTHLLSFYEGFKREQRKMKVSDLSLYWSELNCREHNLFYLCKTERLFSGYSVLRQIYCNNGPNFSSFFNNVTL